MTPQQPNMPQSHGVLVSRAAVESLAKSLHDVAAMSQGMSTPVAELAQALRRYAVQAPQVAGTEQLAEVSAKMAARLEAFAEGLQAAAELYERLARGEG